MKSSLIAILFCLPLITLAHTVEPKIPGKSDKEEKHQLLLDLISDRQFVLESHTLYGRYGHTAFVSPTTNFISVDGEDAIIQLAFNNHSGGFNGLGGITLKGKLTKYEIRDRGAGKGVHIRMTFFGSSVNDLFMEVSDSGFAIIDLSGIRGERLRMKGQVVALEESTVYQSIEVY